MLLNWYSSMKKSWERFGWLLTYKVDSESKILALFDTSPQYQCSKFNNFHWICWFLDKNLTNLTNFVPPDWKLNNPYYHKCTYSTKYLCIMKFLRFNGVLILFSSIPDEISHRPRNHAIYKLHLWLQGNDRLHILPSAKHETDGIFGTHRRCMVERK